MTLSTEYKVDRSRFGKGPWDNEPEDRIEWRSEQGTPLIMMRAPLGHWCGYVGVAKDHPFYGLGFEGWQFDCHGALTYAEDHLPREKASDTWWYGFDCAHAGDISPGLRPGAIGPQMRGNHGFLVNQATAFGDWKYRDKDYVKKEVEHLCKQIEEAANCEGCGRKLARWNKDGEFGFLCTTMGCEI